MSSPLQPYTTSFLYINRKLVYSFSIVFLKYVCTEVSQHQYLTYEMHEDIVIFRLCTVIFKEKGYFPSMLDIVVDINSWDRYEIKFSAFLTFFLGRVVRRLHFYVG